MGKRIFNHTSRSMRHRYAEEFMHKVRIKIFVDEEHTDTYTLEVKDFKDAWEVRMILTRRFTSMVEALQSAVYTKEKLNVK